MLLTPTHKSLSSTRCGQEDADLGTKVSDLVNLGSKSFSTDSLVDNETGRVNAVYPGSSLHYIQLIEQPRYEDYNITYQNRHNQ